jgi:hypothetical protein
MYSISSSVMELSVIGAEITRAAPASVTVGGGATGRSGGGCTSNSRLGPESECTTCPLTGPLSLSVRATAPGGAIFTSLFRGSASSSHEGCTVGRTVADAAFCGGCGRSPDSAGCAGIEDGWLCGEGVLLGTSTGAGVCAISQRRLPIAEERFLRAKLSKLQRALT